MRRFIKGIVLMLVALTLMVSATLQAQQADGTGSTASEPLESLRVVLVPAREARISAPMEGRLIALPVPEGGVFAKGDILARFDCATRLADKAIAEARLEKARLRYQSQLELQSLQAVSELDVLLAKADQEESEASLKQARAAADRCVVIAPYDGRIVKTPANQHEILAVNAPLFDIVSSEELRAEMLVPSRWLSWLGTGSRLDIHIEELDTDVVAVVSRMGSRIDPVSQTISIYATIEGEQHGLLPGMSGEARFRRSNDGG